MDEDVDGGGDEVAGDGSRDLLDEGFEACEAAAGGVGVDGGESAGVAGVPCFEKVEGSAVAYFADDDTGGA